MKKIFLTNKLCILSSSFCILHFAFCISAFAQGNPAARYEIDAKRIGVMPTDKDALPRSREFIRLDSTYYVGYMYEGMYKADKSSDYVGFRNAIPALRKSFLLFQRDFGRSMRTVFSSPENYMGSITRYIDFLQVSNSLKECYDNIEMADSVMWVLDQVDKYKFPKEHLPTTTIKAWTYHRNRFFTSEKFPFLKNSVAENEKMAFSLCYYALGKINRNRAQNDMWFGPNQAANDRMSVYHYLALLHAYNKNYDSSDYYYQRQVEGATVSWNNYGNMKHELGELATAYDFINRDKYKSYEKHLREPFYFIPILDVYAGKTKEAMSLSKEAIEFAGSTPGFGWYNIALSRSYLYDGQLDSAEHTLNKAADFKEIHIGTTLTQSQFDFTVNLLRLQLIDKKMSQEKFLNKGWWYSPTALYALATLKVDKLMLQYVLINQLAANPERERTVYDLFCSEATTTWDEAFYLIKDFSPNFFINKYEQYQANDPRPLVNRYFTLFRHQIEWAKGDEKKAFEGYKKINDRIVVDTAFEKLFVARVYEGLYKGNKNEDNENRQLFYANSLYETYPQLMPFNKVKLKIKLNVRGDDDETTKAVVKEMKRANIEWVEQTDNNTAIANIDFTKKGDRYEATINTKGALNKSVVTDEKMVFKNATGAGKELALRLFGKSGAMVFEKAL